MIREERMNKIVVGLVDSIVSEESEQVKKTRRSRVEQEDLI